MDSNNYTERLNKCYTGVIHDVMRDLKYRNFTLPPSIRPSKNNHVLSGQVFTVEGKVDKNFDPHETLLAWTAQYSGNCSNGGAFRRNITA